MSGQVLLGPTCPVEAEGQPCEDSPATDVAVTVHEPSGSDPTTPGEAVADGRTGDDGRFRIDLDPGDYLVTAEAGMYCEPVPVAVVAGEYAEVDVHCDTGIR